MNFTERLNFLEKRFFAALKESAERTGRWGTEVETEIVALKDRVHQLEEAVRRLEEARK